MASCGTPAAKQGRGQDASLGGFMGSSWGAYRRPLGGIFDAPRPLGGLSGA